MIKLTDDGLLAIGFYECKEKAGRMDTMYRIDLVVDKIPRYFYIGKESGKFYLLSNIPERSSTSKTVQSPLEVVNYLATVHYNIGQSEKMKSLRRELGF